MRPSSGARPQGAGRRARPAGLPARLRAGLRAGLRVGGARQGGSAPVELILILPFLLFIILLAFNSTRLMLVKQQVIVEARTTAWRGSLLGPGNGRSRCPPAFGAMLGAQPIWTDCAAQDDAAGPFLGRLNRGGYSAGLVADLRRQAALPHRIDARAYSLFSPSRGLGWPLRVESAHAVDAQPIWLHTEMPIGYDRYLNDVIDSDYIFPRFFPRVR